jgi:hypothetical protein
MWNITRTAAAGLIVLLILGGCGSGDKGEQAAATRARAAKKAMSPQDLLARSLVGGATSVKPGSAPLPVQVKFALRTRPDVAQPLDIDIAIVPTASNLDRIFGKVEGEEGLELVGSGELAEADKPVENTPIERSVQVLPKQDGIYTLTATVSVDMGGQISTQSYSFPVIAGQGMPDLPAAPAPAATTTASTKGPPAAH